MANGGPLSSEYRKHGEEISGLLGLQLETGVDVPGQQKVLSRCQVILFIQGTPDLVRREFKYRYVPYLVYVLLKLGGNMSRKKLNTGTVKHGYSEQAITIHSKHDQF